MADSFWYPSVEDVLTIHDEIRSLLKQFGTDEATVGEATVTESLRSHPEEIDLASEIGEWRDELIRYGLDEPTGSSSDLDD
jgi:death-on-curing protein